MTALNRKLLSTLWRMRGPLLAIAAVLASGVAVFVMSQATLSSLALTRNSYYHEYRFADVFAHLKRAPRSVAAQIAAIPQVRNVQARVADNVLVDVAGFAEPVVGRILSVPADGQPEINQLYLRQGRLLEPMRHREVLVHEAFALAHGLKPGATIGATINGHQQQLQVVGIVLSPEFVYAIRPGELLPDDRRYGVLWMDEANLAAALDLDGAFNDLALTLEPGANERAVIERVDRLLARFGGTGAYGRSDQSSHKVLANELTQLRSMALVFPVIALCVTAFLLHVVFSRLVATEREEIATLKAFGYTRFEIGAHYVKLASVMVAVGVLAGSAIGVWLAQDLAELYVRYFRFPVFLFRLDAVTLVSAAGLCSAAAFLGAAQAVRHAAGLPPAEAMKPEAPAQFRPTIVERLGWQQWFSPLARMVLRYLERQPVRALLTTLGIALAIAVLVLGSFIEDSVGYVMDFQFNLAQRQDVTIGFADALSHGAIHDVRHLSSVTAVQPYRSVAARLRSGHHERRIAILGLPHDRPLYRVIDAHERELDLPEEGLVLSSMAAQALDVGVGDNVVIEVLEGERPVRPLRVTGLIDDFGEPTAYMNLGTLRRFLREGERISGAFVSVDARGMAALNQQLKRTPKVASVARKSAALETFRRLFAEHLLRMRAFDVIFASIMVFGVVYNSARVALSERSRDLATLRILGFTRHEIFRILLGELTVLTAAAIPLGLVLGYYFSAVAIWALETETQRFPLVIERSTYGFAIAVVIAATLCSAVAVRRRLDRLDLIAVLKAKE